VASGRPFPSLAAAALVIVVILFNPVHPVSCRFPTELVAMPTLATTLGDHIDTIIVPVLDSTPS